MIPGTKSAGESQALMALIQAQGNPDATIKAADDLLTKYADTTFKETALLEEANAYQQKGDDDKAQIYGERVLEANPKSFQAELMLGEMLAQPYARERSRQGREADQGREVPERRDGQREYGRQAESADHRRAVGRRQEVRYGAGAQRSRAGGAGAQEVRRSDHRVQNRGRHRSAAGLPGSPGIGLRIRRASTPKRSRSATRCSPIRSFIRRSSRSRPTSRTPPPPRHKK